mmetsp:Transcript_4512/g.6798  ORF Transcript_4512/g.6798 Transcript_4512/m.6798 type:complete len:82 (-) Transcript_4512:1723-1968(-)
MHANTTSVFYFSLFLVFPLQYIPERSARQLLKDDLLLLFDGVLSQFLHLHGVPGCELACVVSIDIRCRDPLSNLLDFIAKI